MQNNMEDLFGILNVLDPENFDDEDDFYERFGKGMPTPEQVQDLQVYNTFSLKLSLWYVLLFASLTILRRRTQVGGDACILTSPTIKE